VTFYWRLQKVVRISVHPTACFVHFVLAARLQLSAIEIPEIKEKVNQGLKGAKNRYNQVHCRKQ
jgi:hypothetical protein